ncbi:hypothetical protein CPAR01_14458 [Colletotrichum paranaense]|uniref:Uncharacterized protein n=6 Tax=Colletotrichum acutatum species complex TaxID=2707335 RepID=A0A9P9XSQ2_9PEZI|nr:uncharacterized protein CLUP02_12786 [Colletotrichum lupini]XP_060310064.1 uncharacterized protein CCOS01_11179 [Colletotrichum costaricense]XP_060342770.1 uncharacterized protein CPAR01_14458 [Colletotrichum paranaense]XP_060402943.1 uncharacterized protein CABS01_07412 [Colletotrichum abscissum]KAI3544651.1 hypothetical protein CSPX01_05450 [Colletotrichum filicis]KAK0378192.1 hypothetical protein CLIM01_04437 [Colletotrichum limetticola]KAK1461649.1 hypothetical protein CMEL01_14603 [Co
MSLQNGAYTHQGYSAPPYSQGYNQPPGGQMYGNDEQVTQVYYYNNDDAASISSRSISQHQQQYWYGQQPGGGRSCRSSGSAKSPENERFNRKRRRCTYMYYVLRQLAIIVPLVVIFLNINIYCSRRGKYLNDSTSPADPIFYSLWLSVPISCILLIWSLITVIWRKRDAYRGGIPKHFHFGMELCFTLGTTICWILLVIQIESKKSNGYYAYPYIQYEAALAFLLGLIMMSEFGLLARAWFEFTNERTRYESEMMQV